MIILENIIRDRGSRYAVSGAPCVSESAAKICIEELKKRKPFSKATHHSWALLTNASAIKNDDGERGAGMVILPMLERAELRNHLIIVTRWYGGKHLGGDRFRHVQDAVQIYLAQI
ncbi:MAG: YigZ family protein [Pseudomonadota bacterium]